MHGSQCAGRFVIVDQRQVAGGGIVGGTYADHYEDQIAEHLVEQAK